MSLIPFSKTVRSVTGDELYDRWLFYDSSDDLIAIAFMTADPDHDYEKYDALPETNNAALVKIQYIGDKTRTVDHTEVYFAYVAGPAASTN